jgi:hypothetical protein
MGSIDSVTMKVRLIMRKKGFVLMVCLSILLLIPGMGNAEEEQINSKKVTFGIKLTGGMNYLSVGDWNTSMMSETEQLGNWASSMGASFEGGFDKIHWGMDFEGEVIIYLNPRFGITIGSGYISGSKGTGANKITVIRPTITNTITFNTTVSAVPIKIGVHYSFATSAKTRFFLNGGAGYYFARLSSAYRHETSDGSWYNADEKVTGNGLGIHGGAGFEFDISKNIAIVFEGFGRYANIGGFEGNWEERNHLGVSNSGEGPLYYFEWEWTGDWYTTVTVGNAPPAEPNRRNVREAKVDFSGFMLRVGIRIRF